MSGEDGFGMHVYNVDYDIDDICEKIHENVPGVEIYEVVRNAEGTECLRKNL